jgi:uncharacterized membrane protein YfcA
MPELSDLAAGAAIVLTGALAQGFLGFGFAIVAMIGLTLSRDLLHAAGVVNLTGILVAGSVLLALRREVLWRPALRMVPGVLVGVVLGVSALGSLDRDFMVRALGVTIIAISLWNLRAAASVQRKEAPLWDGVTGLIGGFLGGAFNTGGPAIVAHLYRRPDPPQAVKATNQLIFLTMGLMRLPTASAKGQMTSSIWIEAGVMAPFVLVGLFAGIRLGRQISPAHFQRVSWLALGAIGSVLVISP